MSHQNVEDCIYDLMKQKGISQMSVAAELGMSPQHFNDLLRKRRPMRVKHILPICKALSCEPNEIFGYEKENHQITVTDNDGQVIAAVIGNSVVEHDGYHIILS